ncbi:MAG TPA: branched-chain amino acid ABC transporter permease [Methylomirabilota bacterium]|nr:branched-chain amino acid ABC transporter permease [Methylomirabilota bacterium]
MARLTAAVFLAIIAVAPFLPMGGMRQYALHVLVQIFIWSFIGGAWSLMGRFGLISLGHGAFLGAGAYTTTLLWNVWGLTPWLGVLVAVAGAVVIGLVLGYPCFRFRVVGHYFALVTLAVGEVVRLLVIAERDWTGGSLGVTLKASAGEASLVAIQFADKRVFYYASVALWLGGLWVWRRVDRSMARSALEAIGEDETAAASVGIHVTRFKLAITVLSAALTAVGGVLYAQYFTYVNPDTLSGIGVSLRIVFAVVLGGMYSLLGPTVGSALTIALSEYLRVLFGLKFIGMAETIYGLVLILCIIFLPAGIYGSLRAAIARRMARSRAAPA